MGTVPKLLERSERAAMDLGGVLSTELWRAGRVARLLGRREIPAQTLRVNLLHRAISIARWLLGRDVVVPIHQGN